MSPGPAVAARPEPGGAITVALRNEDEARDTDEVVLLLVSPAPSTTSTYGAEAKRGKRAPSAASTSTTWLLTW